MCLTLLYGQHLFYLGLAPPPLGLFIFATVVGSGRWIFCEEAATTCEILIGGPPLLPTSKFERFFLCWIRDIIRICFTPEGWGLKSLVLLSSTGLGARCLSMHHPSLGQEIAKGGI